MTPRDQDEWEDNVVRSGLVGCAVAKPDQTLCVVRFCFGCLTVVATWDFFGLLLKV